MTTYSWRRHWSPHHCQNQNGSIGSWGCLLWKENPPGDKVEKVRKKEKSPITANTSFKEMKPGGKIQLCSAAWRSCLAMTPWKCSFFPHEPTGHVHQAPSPNQQWFPHTFTRLVMDARRYLGTTASNKGSRDRTSCRNRAPHVIWVEERRNWGGREKREEQSRISVLEFPLLTSSVVIRKQQQIILSIRLRPRHLESTPQIPRKPKILILGLVANSAFSTQFSVSGTAPDGLVME